MPELLAHLTTFLAEERGRILLDNALGEGLNVAALLGKGVDARRRSLAMKTDELERRIKMLEEDLAGRRARSSSAASRSAKRSAASRSARRRTSIASSRTTIRQLPNVIDSAKREDLRKFLPGVPRGHVPASGPRPRRKEIGGKLEALAEKTIALIKEDAHDADQARRARRSASDVKKLDVQIDTFRYDVGIAALLARRPRHDVRATSWSAALLALAAPDPRARSCATGSTPSTRSRRRSRRPTSSAHAAQAGRPEDRRDDRGLREEARHLGRHRRRGALPRGPRGPERGARRAREGRQGRRGRSRPRSKRRTRGSRRRSTRVEELRATLWGPKDKVRVAESSAALPMPATERELKASGWPSLRTSPRLPRRRS